MMLVKNTAHTTNAIKASNNGGTANDCKLMVGLEKQSTFLTHIIEFPVRNYDRSGQRKVGIKI